MYVLSLFDGISCGQQSLLELGIKVDKYYSSEIDKTAIQITKKNHPGTEFIGNVNDIDFNNYKHIDLLLGGSPCQGFSNMGHQKGFNDDRSKLFFKYIEALNIIKPKYFLLENVRLKKEWLDIISKETGVEGIFIDSRHFSEQSRKRFYWTNIKIDTNFPVNTSTYESILETGITYDYLSNDDVVRYYDYSIKYKTNIIISANRRKDKVNTLLTGCGSKQNCGLVFKNENGYRWATMTELERLQTLPDNYTLTNNISNSKRGYHIGNGWNVETIKYILKNII